MSITITIEGNHAADIVAEGRALFVPPDFMAALNRLATGAGPSVTDPQPAPPPPPPSPNKPLQPSETAAKPEKYRGKDADTIATRIIERIKNGEEATAGDVGDVSRLPKKWQERIADAEKAVEQGRRAAEALVYPLHNDDGALLSPHDTVAEWVEALVERVNDASSIKELDKLAAANRGTIVAIGEIEGGKEAMGPAGAAYAARREALTEPVGETKAAEEAQPTEPATSERPLTVADAREAIKLMLATKDVGAKVAAALLGKFGCKAASDLAKTPGKIAGFIAAANEACGGAVCDLTA